MIRNVVFDLGRVIYTYQPREDLLQLGYDDEFADHFMERVYDNPLWLEGDRGTYTIHELVEKLCSDFPDMTEDFKRVLDDEWHKRVIKIMQDSLEFFYDVKRRGFAIYILSNFPEPFFSQCRARDAFFDEADGIVVSAHEKLIKPDPDIFKCLLNRYDLEPKETIFIDDVAKNTDAARALGLWAIQFTDIEECKQQFEEILKKSAQVQPGGF